MSLSNLIAQASTLLDTPDLDVTLGGLATTSSKIRYLASQNMSTADISKKLGVRYQHVRNVLLKPLKSA
jgi:hypothetical protein